MKKNIIALVAAASVVALSGVGASAWDHNLNLTGGTGNYAAGQNINLQLTGSKIGCTVETKLHDETDIMDNEDVTGWSTKNIWSTKQRVLSSFPTKDWTNLTLKAPALAGYYEIDSTLRQNTTPGCKDLGSGTSDYKDIRVGDEVYFDTVNWDAGDEVHAGLNDYYVRWDGSVMKSRNNTTAAGVVVELWVSDISGDRLYKAASATTNALGEFKINYTFDEDAHYYDDFQLRVQRTAKYFNDVNDDDYYSEIWD